MAKDDKNKSVSIGGFTPQKPKVDTKKPLGNVGVAKQKKKAQSVVKLIEERDGFESPKSRLNQFTEGSPEWVQAARDYNSLTLEIQSIDPSKGGAIIDIPTVVNDPSDPLGNEIKNKGLIVDTTATGTSIVNSNNPLGDYKNAGSEHFIYAIKQPTIKTHPKAKLDAFNTVVTTDVSYNSIEKKILQDYTKSEGGIAGLLDTMYNAGLITDQTRKRQDLASNDFSSGLQYALREYSKQVLRDYEVNGKKDPIAFADYIVNGLQSKKTSDTTYQSHITTRDTAASDLDKFFKDWLGRGASKEEHDQYYQMVRSAEKKTVVATTKSGNTITTSGDLLDAMDYLEMQRKVAGKAIVGSDIDVVLKSGAAGAQAVNDVMSYAGNYGVHLAASDALKYVSDALKNNQGDTKSVKAKMLNISKSLYSNIADSITDEVSLKDLSNNYRYEMSKTLELNYDSLDANDPLIQTALRNGGNKGLMNLTDFNKLLRNDTRWAATNNAREEASNYAIDILKSFGLMA